MTEIKRHYPTENIISAVTEVFDISRQEIFQKTRKKEIAEARQVVAYYLRLTNEMSFPAIARAVGEMDHTTAMYSFRRVVSKMKEDSKFYAKVQRVFDRIENPDTPLVEIPANEPDENPLSENTSQETAKIKKPKHNISMRDFTISEREKNMMEKYRQGMTLQKISDDFGITRERVRQIIFKANLKEIGAKTKDGFEIDIDEYVRAEKAAHEQAKRGEETESETDEGIKNGEEKRWSRYYIRCRGCGTTQYPHARNGYCERCIGARSRKTKEKILTNESRCSSCGIDRGAAIGRFGRDLYVTKEGKILCRGCFLQFTGRKLGHRNRRGAL